MGRRIYLGLGGNLGDRRTLLEQALQAIASDEDIALINYSSIYETPPWGLTEQPAFYNMVACVETTLPPLDLMHRMQRIEERLGRVRSIPWGPRTMDIDLLCSTDGKMIESEELHLPHPYLYERAFVLIPLAEIAPTLSLGKTTAKAYAAHLADAHTVVPVGQIDRQSVLTPVAPSRSRNQSVF